MKEIKVLAFDFGASSGRGIIGGFDGNILNLTEIHRFLNNPTNLDSKGLCWNFSDLMSEMKKGISKADKDISALSIDTWGVDYGCLDKNGNLVEMPRHYRNDRNKKAREELDKKYSKTKLFEQSGISGQVFNTASQFYAMVNYSPEVLANTADILFVPDLMTYYLTGNKSTEITIASTSELMNANGFDFNTSLISSIGVNPSMIPEIIRPSTKIGGFLPNIQLETGRNFDVFKVASHDTASAVLAVPSENDDCCYISSGTWSLLGTILDNPNISKDAFDAGYTNERAYDGRYRFLKNIMGLWLIQECKRSWDKHGEVLSFAEIAKLAEQATPDKCFIDVNDDCFLAPNNMPERIVDYCRKNGGKIPETKGEIARTIFEGLAFAYAKAIKDLEKITGKKFSSLHIVGGGANNAFLNQLTANATGLPVYVGPFEATAIGNIVASLIGLGYIKNQYEAKQIIKKSFDCAVVNPNN